MAPTGKSGKLCQTGTDDDKQSRSACNRRQTATTPITTEASLASEGEHRLLHQGPGREGEHKRSATPRRSSSGGRRIEHGAAPPPLVHIQTVEEVPVCRSCINSSQHASLQVCARPSQAGRPSAQRALMIHAEAHADSCTSRAETVMPQVRPTTTHRCAGLNRRCPGQLSGGGRDVGLACSHACDAPAV